MNHKAMLELADRLEREMPRVNMGTSIMESECGAVCCIAGWFCLWNLGFSVRDRMRGFCEPMKAAQVGLDLCNDDADDLFYVSNWPDGLRKKHIRCHNLKDDLARNQLEIRLMSERIRRMVREDIAKAAI